jgi:hypothetical protein
MKPFVGFRCIFVCILALSLPAESFQATSVEESPAKRFIEEYWKMESNGGRLTAEGWNKANRFYVHAKPVPSHIKISVYANDFTIWEPFVKGIDLFGHPIKEGTAQAIVESRQLAHIDTSFRYSPPEDALKTFVGFNLVSDSHHWDLDTDNKTEKPINGPMQWRIADDADAGIYLNLKTAIFYVTQVRDKTNDPVVKKIAASTLAALRAAH